MEQKSRKISNFHLTRSLYQGSKTEVHQGRFAQSGGVVQRAAVKVLNPRYACIGHELRAFLAEAGWASELRSSLFPRVFEAGEHQGNYFIAMEFVDGWTLAKVLGSLATLQVPLPCEVGLSLASQLAAGLHKMHEVREHDELMGIVHLGVNPENVMLTKDGHAKLLDFGMTLASVDRELTEPDDKAVEYQSPERRRGLPVDRRADIFSIGRILEYMVECMVPDVVRDDLPALIARACHQDPDQRFNDMKDFNVALRLVAKNRGLSPTRAACEKFTLEIFGHKVAKIDPRAKRPQPAVPLKMSSEHQKTSYEPVTPPPQAHLPGSTGEVGNEEATVVGEAIPGKATARGERMAGKEMMDGKATTMGEAMAGKATVMGEMDPNLTAFGSDIESTTRGEVYREKPTVVSAAFDPHATAVGESASGMTTVPRADAHGTATSVGPAPENPHDTPRDTPRFVDEHLAVTSTGGSAAPQGAADDPVTPDSNPTDEVTAFSVPAASEPEAKAKAEAKAKKGGFREELIPTKPYAAHDIDES